MIESNRTVSYGNGRILRRGDPPTCVPVLLRPGRVLLTEDGWYVSVETGSVMQTEVPW